MGYQPLRQGQLGAGFGASGLGRADDLLHALLRAFEIGKHELQLDDVDVANGVDRAGDVHHVAVLEATHHHQDRVGFSDVGQELVAQALAFGRAGDQAGDVHDLDDGRHQLLGRDEAADELEPRVRHRHDAHVGVDRAEGIVRGLGLARRQGVEDRAFAYVGKPNDTDRKCHGAHDLARPHPVGKADRCAPTLFPGAEPGRGSSRRRGPTVLVASPTRSRSLDAPTSADSRRVPADSRLPPTGRARTRRRPGRCRTVRRCPRSRAKPWPKSCRPCRRPGCWL
jgi:hypothetical protein